MNNRRHGIGPAVALAWLGLSACASQTHNQPPQQEQLGKALAAPERVDPPEPLSPVVRSLLKERMATHARDMANLMSAIMTLEYSSIAIRANAIADDANFSRPLSSDASELNAQIPPKFFVRQDDLKEASRRLAGAARSHNPYKVADAYGRLAETCVRCHADFRPALDSNEP